MSRLFQSSPGRGASIAAPLLIATERYANPRCGTTMVAHMLAQEFSRSGRSITLICEPLRDTEQDVEPLSGVEVVRSRRGLFAVGFRKLAASHVILVHPKTVNMVAIVATGRPAVLSFHTWFANRCHKRLLVRLLSTACPLIACSAAVREQLGLRVVVVKNGYMQRNYRISDKRCIDVLFVGRICAEKGADIAIECAKELKKLNEGFRIVIAGPPDDAALMIKLRKSEADGSLEYRGAATHSEIYSLMSSSRVLLIPSRGEAFGIVALEGLDCGCRVVASSSGGLPEAVGKFGAYVDGHDPKDWSRAAAAAIASRDEPPREDVELHLKRHDPRRFARNYLRLADRARPWPTTWWESLLRRCLARRKISGGRGRWFVSRPM